MVKPSKKNNGHPAAAVRSSVRVVSTNDIFKKKGTPVAQQFKAHAGHLAPAGILMQLLVKARLFIPIFLDCGIARARVREIDIEY